MLDGEDLDSDNQVTQDELQTLLSQATGTDVVGTDLTTLYEMAAAQPMHPLVIVSPEESELEHEVQMVEEELLQQGDYIVQDSDFTIDASQFEQIQLHQQQQQNQQQILLTETSVIQTPISHVQTCSLNNLTQGHNIITSIPISHANNQPQVFFAQQATQSNGHNGYGQPVTLLLAINIKPSELQRFQTVQLPKQHIQPQGTLVTNTPMAIELQGHHTTIQQNQNQNQNLNQNSQLIIQPQNTQPASQIVQNGSQNPQNKHHKPIQIQPIQTVFIQESPAPEVPSTSVPTIVTTKPLVRRSSSRKRAVKPPASSIISSNSTPGAPDLLSCSVCGKNFVSVTRLTSHEKTHSKSRPFTCIDCGKTFTVRYSLICHTRVHTRERPYACTECGARFSQASSLKTHQIYKHTQQFPYPCKICQRGFISPGQRHEHMSKIHSTHSGRKSRSKGSSKGVQAKKGDDPGAKLNQSQVDFDPNSKGHGDTEIIFEAEVVCTGDNSA